MTKIFTQTSDEPQTVKTPEGKTFTILPFNKIRKYGGKYVFTQTNTIANEKYEEYSSPCYVPDTLIDYYYYMLIKDPNTTLPLKVPLDTCKAMIRNLAVRIESKIRDVSTSLFIQKKSYDEAVSNITSEIQLSSDIFWLDSADEIKLYESYDIDTVSNQITSSRAFTIDIVRAKSILSNLKNRPAADLHIYSGGPGTGKTHRCIEDIRHNRHKKILVTSLSNIVGLRFLSRLNLKGSEQWSFTKVAFSRHEKLDVFDAIIVEEASMISSSEFSAIEKLVNTNLPIYFLGDPYQLPGFTGLGNLFATLLDEFKSSVVYLTSQHRMEDSVYEVVERVKSTGILPKSDLHFNEAVGEFVRWIQNDEDSIAVTYRNKDCLELNDYAIASGLGLDSEYKASKNDSQGKDVDPAQWEAVLKEAMQKNIPLRVISTANLSKKKGDKFVRVLSNGEQGIVTYEYDTFIFTSKEDSRTVQEFTLKDMIMNFRLGYALTIHKAQGSEWSKVLYLEPKQDFNMRYSLNHRYVAITRAKEKLIWCDNNSRSVRNAFLEFNNIITNTRI